MVEFGNSWEFDDDLLDILDFPMENLEGDELVGDWDISNLQCLGPIPSIDMWPLCGFAGPINGATGQQQPSSHVDTFSSHIHQPNISANVQDSGAFKTQSPVSVLESSGSCLGGKGLSINSNNTIPIRSRSKRVRPVGVNPWLLASPGFSTPQNAQRSNESKKKSFSHPSMDFMKDFPEKVENLKSASSNRSVVTKKCLHCESTKTPQWRDGPMGPKSLCNACGVRYRSGRLFPEYRPVKSPSFAPLKHSNTHKKVIEMRNKQPTGILKITEVPEQKQLSYSVRPSTSYICRRVSLQESGAFETQSPVSVLESRSKRVRSARVNPLLLASKMNTTSKETLQIPILESRSSILEGKSSFVEHDNTITVQRRKRVRSTRLNQSFLVSSELPTSQKTLNARRSKEGKKKPLKAPPMKVENSPAISDPGHGQNSPSVNRKCAHCASTETPQWRKGPMGLLCNACGVRYRKGRLFPEYRPADSPTFVPSKHSNSHKRVIEMRNKAEQPEGKIKVTQISTQQEAKTEEPPPSPQPEFVPMSSYFFDYIN